MLLTRLRLDPRSAQARRDLSDPYEMHRTLMRAYSVVDDRKGPRLLWRLEPSASWSDPLVLVQSAQEGDWRHESFVSGYFKCEPETRTLDPESWVSSSEQFRFRLFANPTVTRDGKRQGLPTEDQQVDWLARQGARFGFDVKSVLVTGSDRLHSKKDGHLISLLRVCFEGVLSVRDPMALVRAVEEGVGPGKALGCGLLSLGRS